MITHTSSPAQATPATTPSHPARRAGLRSGSVLLVVEIVHGAVGIQPLPLPLTALFFLIAFAGLLLAGAISASASRRVSTGMLAGLLAGLLLGIGFAVGTTIGAITHFAALRAVYENAARNAHIGYSDQLVVAITIVTILLASFVSICGGAICGALGGWLGRRYAVFARRG